MKKTAAIVEFGTSKVLCAMAEKREGEMLLVKGAGRGELPSFGHEKWLGAAWIRLWNRLLKRLWKKPGHIVA